MLEAPEYSITMFFVQHAAISSFLFKRGTSCTFIRCPPLCLANGSGPPLCLANGFCCLGFKCTTLVGHRLRYHKVALKVDTTLSGIVMQLQTRWCTFTDYGELARKYLRFYDDDALAKMVHFLNCDVLGTIATQPSTCGAHNKRSSEARYAIFLKVQVQRVFDACTIVF